MQPLRLAVAVALLVAEGAEGAAPNALSWRPHSEDDISGMVDGLANEIDYASAETHPQAMATATKKQGALLKKASRSPSKPRHPVRVPPPSETLDSYIGDTGGGAFHEFSTHWKSASKGKPKAKATAAARPVESNVYLRDLEPGNPVSVPSAPVLKVAAPRPRPSALPVVPMSAALKNADKLADELDDTASGVPTMAWESKPAPLASTASLARTNSYLDSVGMADQDDDSSENSLDDSSAAQAKLQNPYLKALGSRSDQVKAEVAEAMQTAPKHAAGTDNPYLRSIISDKDDIVLS